MGLLKMSCSVNIIDLSYKIEDIALFENISLDVSHKEKVAIVGANGSGKTTLLKIIAGLIKQSSGEIKIFHESMKNLNDFDKHRGDIGYLFQDSDDQFIAPTVLEDVAFSLVNMGLDKEEAFQKARAQLVKLEIENLEDKIVYRLSGGEKRIVALAGILVLEPKILLLDEPSNALDDGCKKRVQNILNSIDSSTIIVSHELDFIKKVECKEYELTQKGLLLIS